MVNCNQASERQTIKQQMRAYFVICNHNGTLEQQEIEFDFITSGQGSVKTQAYKCVIAHMAEKNYADVEHVFLLDYFVP